MPRVFPLEQIKRMAPLDRESKIFGLSVDFGGLKSLCKDLSFRDWPISVNGTTRCGCGI